MNHITYYDFIPNAETFMQSNNAIYELFGLLYYKNYRENITAVQAFKFQYIINDFVD